MATTTSCTTKVSSRAARERRLRGWRNKAWRAGPSLRAPVRACPCSSARPAGWSRKYDEWIEESGLLKFDKTLVDQQVDEAAAGIGEDGEAPTVGQLAAQAAQAIQKCKADIAAEQAKNAELPTQASVGPARA